MTSAPTERFPRPLLGVLALQAVWLVAARLCIGVGWGWSPVIGADGGARLGWMTNLLDSLSYASWMEQARNGSGLSELIYTTSPHPHVYFNPVLWTAGTLARFSGTAPTGWLNLAGFAAALCCTSLVYALALRLDLGRPAAFWSAVVTAFGSGSSWITTLLSKLIGTEAIRGADLRFMDLIPAPGAVAYPFHTIGFALVGLLWWLALNLETTPTPRRWIAFVAVAAVLSTSRPYEPAAFAGIYGLYTLSALFTPTHRTIGLRRLRIAVALGLGIGPGVVYSLWLSTQPVWRDFAALSLSLGHPRPFWLVGFGGLWLLAAFGLPHLLRGGNSPRYLPAFWYLFLAIWLLVLDSPRTKLAAGGALALALVAGTGLAALFARFSSRPRPARLAFATTVFVLGAGPASLLALVRESTLFPPRVEPAFLAVGEQLRPASGRPTPTVLCELSAGAALPGVAGLRVVCGHWSLTDHYEERRQWLAEAGLEPDAPPHTASAQFTKLRALLGSEKCDYLLVSRHRPVATLVAADPSFTHIADHAEWRLYRVRPSL